MLQERFGYNTLTRFTTSSSRPNSEFSVIYNNHIKITQYNNQSSLLVFQFSLLTTSVACFTPEHPPACLSGKEGCGGYLQRPPHPRSQRSGRPIPRVCIHQLPYIKVGTVNLTQTDKARSARVQLRVKQGSTRLSPSLALQTDPSQLPWTTNNPSTLRCLHGGRSMSPKTGFTAGRSSTLQQRSSPFHKTSRPY